MDSQIADWKDPALKAHKQWTLGKIEGLRWAIATLKSISAEDLATANERIRKLEQTDRDIDGILTKRMEARQAAKDREKARRAEVHSQFGRTG